jgi:hypothetical protein
VLAAKNKYDNIVEKGTWNAPTAEEKIVGLKAKLSSTMKNLNKKVSFELGEKFKIGGIGKQDHTGKKQTKSGSGENEHPKKWPAPKA